MSTLCKYDKPTQTLRVDDGTGGTVTKEIFSDGSFKVHFGGPGGGTIYYDSYGEEC